MAQKKELMLGNKAVARGLYEAGCCVVSSYPGTPSTEITAEAAKYNEMYCEWAPNEKVAMEVAFGASLAGKRSFCGMKHVGMNVAADPMFTMSYTGVNAGLVIGVADDPGMHSSQNEQDSRRYAIAAKLPMLEPADSEEARTFTKLAYEISEEFDTPVIVKMCTRISHSQSIVHPEERVEAPVRKYEKNIKKNVMLPAHARLKHPFVEERTKKLAEYGATSPLNRIEWAVKGAPAGFPGAEAAAAALGNAGIITSSACYQYTKEVFGDTVSVLKLGMVNPLPEKLIREFAAKFDKLYIIEELDPVIEDQVRTMGLNAEVIGKNLFPICGEFSQSLVAEKMGVKIPDAPAFDENVPIRPPVMCAGCPHRGIFYALSKNNINVLGDIGCYTLGHAEPLNAMHTNLCMGASVSSLHGFNKALGKEGEESTVAIIGDSTFMHTGINGLVDIAYNRSNSTVIIVDNSITAMTGHQQNPSTGLDIHGQPAGKIDIEKLCDAMGIKRVRVVDPYNIAECEEAVKEELKAEEPSVIITRRPCVLLPGVKRLGLYAVDATKCTGCKQCMKIGCPAISIVDKKAVVDASQCTGCGVCEQMCKFGALSDITKNNAK